MREVVVCDGKDLSWYNKKIRALIQEKNATFKNYHNNSNNFDLKGGLKYLWPCLKASIKAAKENYYDKTINQWINTQKNSKTYWSLLKVFLSDKKIPIISSRFYKNWIITDFEEKAKLIKSFFAISCS